MENILTPEVRDIALRLMAGLDCARSLTVSMLIQAGEWVQLAQLRCDPRNYIAASDYRRAVAATDFLRKFRGTVQGIDRDSATLLKWRESEAMCFRTNQRLYELMDFGTQGGLPVPERLLDFIEELKKNMLALIGSGPDDPFEGRFGPGATVSDHHLATTVMHKMASTPTFTPSSWPYLIPWTGTKWAAACAARWDEPIGVRGNIYFSVPKEILIDRSCGKEPSINGYYQLGLGRLLRKRLKRQGIDLDNGQDVHRQVACAASKSGEFCTIDLSSASDTVCTALVKLCVPRRWYSHLDDLRSPFTQVNGVWHRLEKFSSMGNGFTFELETALFTAISMTYTGLTPGVDLFVYGDDIIVPTNKAQDVIWALRYFGFKINDRKTFVDGYFRESCGGDFFDGDSVRAYYLKDEPNEPQHFIAIANGIRRLAKQDVSGSLWANLLRTWFRCLEYVPTSIRLCRGPEELGDLVIHDDEERWHTRWRGSIRYVRVYRPARFSGPAFCRFDADIQIAAALYGVVLYPRKPRPGWPDGFDNRKLIARDGVEGYKVGWSPYS